jgi:hypothetical protein
MTGNIRACMYSVYPCIPHQQMHRTGALRAQERQCSETHHAAFTDGTWSLETHVLRLRHAAYPALVRVVNWWLCAATACMMKILRRLTSYSYDIQVVLMS